MKTQRLHFIGWLLFVVSAVFFIITSVNWWELFASIAFLLGCIAFLVSLFLESR
jgi:hypothetical protein